MKLYGYALDKAGIPVPGASVEIKDDHFQTIYGTNSDENGCYEIEAPAARYPFVIAVRDYGEKNLEYWCQNLDLRQDARLDVRFETLEVYGLHVFTVKGGFPSLMVYFRPMSLTKFLSREENIAPTIKEIKVTVDGQNAAVLNQNQVREYIGDRYVTAYLLQTERPKDTTQWNRLDIEIWDSEDHFGMATIFHN